MLHCIDYAANSTTRKPCFTSTALSALRQSGCLKFLHSVDSLQVAVLGDIGGHDVEDVVVRIMSFLVKTDLAIQFNLCGLRKKRAFKKTNTFSLVFRKSYFMFICSLLLSFNFSA